LAGIETSTMAANSAHVEADVARAPLIDMIGHAPNKRRRRISAKGCFHARILRLGCEEWLVRGLRKRAGSSPDIGLRDLRVSACPNRRLHYFIHLQEWYVE
jgi:hypothetical protein